MSMKQDLLVEFQGMLGTGTTGGVGKKVGGVGLCNLVEMEAERGG